jgi:transglutaminase-like putative cysteine protease
MSRRGSLALLVVLGWLAGLGLLARRELFRGTAQRLAEAALRVAPGAIFYAVTQGAAQIGFASSTIDTTEAGIRVTDYLVADLPVAGKWHRASARSVVQMSRALVLRHFEVSLETEAGPSRVTGEPSGDTLLTVAISSPGVPADTQRIRLDGPVILPTLLPLAVGLGGTPKVGQRLTLPVFDPSTMTRRSQTLKIEAESLFVVSDSAVFDSATMRWRTETRDTVRAWRVASDDGGGFRGWVDEQGRVVEATQPANLTMRRTAYELAFENWRIATGGETRTAPRGDQDILEQSAIAAKVPLRGRVLERLRVRLTGVDLAGFDLQGGRQAMSGDTLTVSREPDELLTATYQLPGDAAHRARFRSELAAEPLLQTGSPAIALRAIRIAGPDHTPRAVAMRLNRWVHDSLAKQVTFGLPNALQVLATRRGDCNEHTQLFLALARALGLPARAAAGLVYLNGRFYYHAWPEVYLNGWVAADPTFGEFPASATHLRFITGGLNRQAELLRLIGNLKIDVVEAK